MEASVAAAHAEMDTEAAARKARKDVELTAIRDAAELQTYVHCIGRAYDFRDLPNGPEVLETSLEQMKAGVLGTPEEISLADVDGEDEGMVNEEHEGGVTDDISEAEDSDAEDDGAGEHKAEEAVDTEESDKEVPDRYADNMPKLTGHPLLEEVDLERRRELSMIVGRWSRGNGMHPERGQALDPPFFLNVRPWRAVPTHSGLIHVFRAVKVGCSSSQEGGLMRPLRS